MADFSCLISCFKNDNPKFLLECLQSVVDQSLKASEIVFVKDGPLSEDLEHVLCQYTSQLPIKFVELTVNKGLGNALSKGLEACSNDIVFRMDTDDICYENRFQLQYDYLMANPEVDILGGWAHDINSNGDIISERKYPTSHKELYKLMWTNPLIHPAVVFRRSKVLSVGSYDPSVVRRQDYELWIRAAAGGLKIENLPAFVIKYRFTENYYKKNDFNVVYKQALMGYKGARKLDLPFYTRIAVFAPVLRSLLPKRIVGPVHRFMSKFDPRK